MSSTIIAIDDEPHNFMLLDEYLQGSGLALKCFPDGEAALDYLRGGGIADLVLLDRMMPEMDGLSFLRAFKALEQHAATPVIMQSAAAGMDDVSEGILTGAYYYLTKPFTRDLLRAIVFRALGDRSLRGDLDRTTKELSVITNCLEEMRLSFRDLDEVRSVSLFVANLYPQPDEAIVGVTEMMLNAVEHGNLGITYAEKCELVRRGDWLREIGRRLALPENGARKGRLCIRRDSHEVVLTIEDDGPGFNWTQYLAFDPRRARDTNGRGIAMARLVSFDDVTYIPPGNKVVCRKRRDAPAA